MEYIPRIELEILVILNSFNDSPRSSIYIQSISLLYSSFDIVWYLVVILGLTCYGIIGNCHVLRIPFNYIHVRNVYRFSIFTNKVTLVFAFWANTIEFKFFKA